MCDLIVMTFDDSEDVTQIRYIVRQWQENSAHIFDATVIAKDHEAKLLIYPLQEADILVSPQPASSPNPLAEKAPDMAFIQEVLNSLPLGGAALFVLVEDDASSTALLTILMLFAPNAMPHFSPEGLKRNNKADAHLCADLETYQAAVANLEVLRSDSTEGDVEVVFKAVDDAYDRLVRFIYAEQETEDA